MEVFGAGERDVAVVMVPFPSQGHLNQLLHLSCVISAAGLTVHYVSTSTHIRQVKRRVQGWDSKALSNIQFHEFLLLRFKTPPPPNPYSPIKFPSHLQPLFEASLLLRQPVGELLRHLSALHRRVVIIHDSIMGSVVQDFIHLPNAESYAFHSVSAFTIFFYLWENSGKPFSVDSEILELLPSMEGCFTPEFTKFIRKQHEYMNLSSGRIYNTCRAVEGSYLELLAKPEINEKKQWAIGPFNPVINVRNSSHNCLNWLDKQAPNSVILVSFGTTTSLSAEEIKELANGLEKSEVKFIWVLRDADGIDVFKRIRVKKAELPEGFEERLKEKGVVVRDWAPQLDILGHSATGGFLSHCGWNSCMESISMGVPIVAWPMHSDQPRNAVLITDVLRIGVTIRKWSCRNRLVKSGAVCSAIRKLMASEGGEEIRKRAVELGGSVKKSLAVGGVTQSELSSFISHITR